MRYSISNKSVNAGLVPHQLDQPDLNDEGLATRMQLKVATIRSWRCRNPQKLPPCGIKIGRNWLYDKEEVERWIFEQRQYSITKTLEVQSSHNEVKRRKRGRPKKIGLPKANLGGIES